MILAAPRTGSNWLCTLLNSHPRVLCHHELFNPGGVHYALDRRDGSLDFGGVDARDRAPSAVLRQVWDAHLGHAAVGFKMTRGQAPEALAIVLADRGIRKVILSRANRVKTAVSEIVARGTGDWESYGTAGEPRRAVMVVDPAELVGVIRENIVFYAGLQAALGRQRPLAIRYEDLDRRWAHHRLAHFLGVHARHLTAGSFKRLPDDLREVVANFHELERAFAGTELVEELRARG